MPIEPSSESRNDPSMQSAYPRISLQRTDRRLHRAFSRGSKYRQCVFVFLVVNKPLCLKNLVEIKDQASPLPKIWLHKAGVQEDRLSLTLLDVSGLGLII